MAEVAGARGITLATAEGAGDADWRVRAVRREGLGHSFELHPPHGAAPAGPDRVCPEPSTSPTPPWPWPWCSNPEPTLPRCSRPWTNTIPFTVEVPGRMQLLCEAPAAIVDFAHNPDALQRTLESVRRPQGTVIVVFGATGERDQTKRPLMGAIAARLADVVIVTDDDPHDEDDAAIRADVLRGARSAAEAAGTGADGPHGP